MSNRVFVHFPPCVSKKLEGEFDKLVRSHPMLSYYGDKVDIYSSPHTSAQVREIEKMRQNETLLNYLVYAALFVLTRFRIPPSMGALNARRLFREDRFKLKYHACELDLCATGVFVPHRDGFFPYDMWRNVHRLLREKKPVWQIVGNEEAGWRMIQLTEMPKRNLRLRRKETLNRLGEFSGPIERRHWMLDLIDRANGKVD